jgi:hypothetical protein
MTQSVTTIEDRPELRKMYVTPGPQKSEVCFPVNVPLACKYNQLMAELRCSLKAAKPDELLRIHTIVRQQHHCLVHGVKAGEEYPDCGESPEAIHDFIMKRSTPYEIFLVDDAALNLKNRKLSKLLKDYEKELGVFFEEKLMSFKGQQISLVEAADMTHMAVEVATNSSELPLSRVLKLKDFFQDYLKLNKVLFEGFKDGCTVLFFAITHAAATFLAPNVLSHLSQLRSEFLVTRILVYDHFAVDITEEDSATSGKYYLLGAEHRMALQKLKEEVADLKKVLQEKERELSSLRNISNGSGNSSISKDAIPSADVVSMGDSSREIQSLSLEKMLKSKVLDEAKEAISVHKHDVQKAIERATFKLLKEGLVKFHRILQTTGQFSTIVTIDDKLLVADDGKQCLHVLTQSGGHLRTIGDSAGLGSDLKALATAYLNEKKAVAIVVSDNKIFIFDISTGEQVHSFQVKADASAVAVSTKGEICVAHPAEGESSHYVISVHRTSGEWVYKIDTLTDSSSDKKLQFGYISSMEFDDSGSLYVADYDKEDIVVLSPPIKDHVVAGIFRTKKHTTSLTITNSGYLLTVSEYTHMGYLYSVSTREMISRFGSKGSKPGEFKSPSSIVMNQSEHVFVADYDNKRIQEFVLAQ